MNSMYKNAYQAGVFIKMAGMTGTTRIYQSLGAPQTRYTLGAETFGIEETPLFGFNSAYNEPALMAYHYADCIAMLGVGRNWMPTSDLYVPTGHMYQNTEHLIEFWQEVFHPTGKFKLMAQQRFSRSVSNAPSFFAADGTEYLLGRVQERTVLMNTFQPVVVGYLPAILRLHQDMMYPTGQPPKMQPEIVEILRQLRAIHTGDFDATVDVYAELML